MSAGRPPQMDNTQKYRAYAMVVSGAWESMCVGVRGEKWKRFEASHPLPPLPRECSTREPIRFQTPPNIKWPDLKL